MQFDHIGIPTLQRKEGEIFVEATRVWITDAHSHPYHVEWPRYEPDRPLQLLVTALDVPDRLIRLRPELAGLLLFLRRGGGG